MKKNLVAVLLVLTVGALSLTACSGSKDTSTVESQAETVVEEKAEPEENIEAAVEEEPVKEEAEEITEEAASEEISEAEETEEPEETVVSLEDGEYVVKFDTDSSMFHVSEACDGKGVLTVKDGEMTIHVSLSGTGILNLYSGLAEDAAKEGAELMEPTTDKVTFEDGTEEEVNGYDIPVPYLDKEFDIALIGKKGKWYDHKVVVSSPENE